MEIIPAWLKIFFGNQFFALGGYEPKKKLPVVKQAA